MLMYTRLIRVIQVEVRKLAPVTLNQVREEKVISLLFGWLPRLSKTDGLDSRRGAGGHQPLVVKLCKWGFYFFYVL